ncbi:putative retrotransposon protein [Tanacetum coccineum]
MKLTMGLEDEFIGNPEGIDEESRFRRFLDNKLEEGDRMWHSIEKGPYDRPMIPNPGKPTKQILELLSKMTEGNKKQYIADVRVMNYILQAIPNNIYNSVDACKNAKDMWERIKKLMFGSDVTSHIRHSRLMNEFDKFTAKEGESLESVNERLTTFVNIMDRNNVRPIPVSINTKFLNCLQPEWSKYVTMVRHNQTGDTVSYDVLYDSLVQFEPHVLASKAKKAAKNHDPLSLLVHSNASLSQSHANSSYSPQPYYVTYPSSVVDYEDEYQGEYVESDFVSHLATDELAGYDVLGFWKANESTFPVISQMAQDILSVQATSVASESAFSTSGRVLSIQRTRVTPASSKMCVCLKDHMDAADWVQPHPFLKTP